VDDTDSDPEVVRWTSYCARAGDCAVSRLCDLADRVALSDAQRAETARVCGAVLIMSAAVKKSEALGPLGDVWALALLDTAEIPTTTSTSADDSHTAAAAATDSSDTADDTNPTITITTAGATAAPAGDDTASVDNTASATDPDINVSASDPSTVMPPADAVEQSASSQHTPNVVASNDDNGKKDNHDLGGGQEEKEEVASVDANDETDALVRAADDTLSQALAHLTNAVDLALSAGCWDLARAASLDVVNAIGGCTPANSQASARYLALHQSCCARSDLARLSAALQPSSGRSKVEVEERFTSSNVESDNTESHHARTDGGEWCHAVSVDAADASVGKLPLGLRCLVLQLHDDDDDTNDLVL